MRTEDISTDIAQLEEEIEQLRRDFKEKVGVIESRITYIKKQLPKDNKRKSGIVIKRCEVIVISGKNKGLKGKVTKVTDQSAWIKSGDTSPFLKRKYNLRVI